VASIDRRTDGRYRARWREYPGGPQKTRHFTRKGDAERFLDAVRGDLAHGTYVDPASGRLLFRDYAEQWRAIQVHRTGTTIQVESYLRLHAYPTLGQRQIGALRRSDIQAWVKEQSRVLAPNSVELVYRWVSTIFKAAVGDRLIASSPCVGITLPKGNDAEVVPLSVTEVEAMVAAVPDRYRALIVFAAGMGLRQGECFGLTVDRVDFLRRRVRVDRQLLAHRGASRSSGRRRARPAFAPYRCPTSWEPPSPLIWPATAQASTAWSSPAAPETRSAATPPGTCGAGPALWPGYPNGQPSMTCATSTPLS